MKRLLLILLLLSAGALVPMISRYLPATLDLTLAVGWLGLDGRTEVLSPIWGGLIRWSFAHVPGSIAFRLGLVSALGGVLCVALLACAVACFLSQAARKAEAQATDGELLYAFPVRLGALLAALSLLVSPPFFLAASRTGPLTVQLVLPLAALALLGVMAVVASRMAKAYLVVAVGFFAALGGFEGAPGILAFPFLLVLANLSFVRGKQRITTVSGLFLLGAFGGGAFAMGDALSVSHVIRSLAMLTRTLPRGFLFPGSVTFVVFVALPVVVLATFIATRRFNTLLRRGICFGVWALAVAVLTAVTCASHPIERGRAADLFVDRALARLGTAKWIVSDGTWDDILRLKKPVDVRLITFRREHDPAHGQELLAWAKECLDANDDLRFAAELGPSKFLSEWFASDAGAVTNCLFLTRLGRTEGGVHLLPMTYGWQAAGAKTHTAATLADEWTAAWTEFAPMLDRQDEPGGWLLTRWFSVHLNSIGAQAAAENRDELAWKTCFKAVSEVFPGNLTALLNLQSLLSRGFRPRPAEEQFVRNHLNARLSALRTMDEARWELASGGRLFVDPQVREKIAQLREERRRQLEDSPVRQLFATVTDEMRALKRLTGEARQKELSRMESTTIASVRTAFLAPWMKNLILGDFAVQKGDDASVEAGRKAYQSMIVDGVGDYPSAFDRLLDVDWKLKRKDWLEYDALLVLRRDIRHQRANASLGMVRLVNGDYESAERFLQRALKVPGGPRSLLKNDLALAFSGLGRHDAAERLIREVVAADPKNWNIQDSLARILRASGKKSEADAVQRLADELRGERTK